MSFNQRKAGILLNYISEGIKILTALIYTPVMLRLLGQSEYGLYQLVSSTVSYLSLLSLGFGSAYVRYHSRYQVKDDREGIARLNGMFLLIFGIMSAACLLCGGAMTVNAELIFGSGLTSAELSKAKILMGILIISMAITFPNSVFTCYVTAHEQFVFQKLLNVFQSLLNPFLALPLLLMGYGSVAVVAVSALLTAVSFAANVMFCVKRLKMRVSFRGLQFSLLKELWGFTFFIFLNQIISEINWSVDKFLLGRMTGTAVVAVYGIGSQINSMYVQMSTAVSNVFIPKVNRVVAESDDNTELLCLMTRVGRVQFLILGLVITGFAFLGRPFIRLWAGEGYEDAYWVAMLLILPVTIPLVQNLGIEIQRAKNMHQARSVVYACLAGGNILLSIILIRGWGCIGAAAGTAIAILLGNGLFMNWYYHKKIGLDMLAFWKEICAMLPAFFIICLFCFAYSCAVQVDGWLQLLFSIMVFTAVYVVVMWFIGMNAYEKQLCRSILSQFPGVRRND